MKNKLTKREETFCRLYSSLGNAREAAYLAGYKVKPYQSGEKLLSRDDIRRQIEKISFDAVSAQRIKAGFSRLAFGSVADAIKLLDGERENLENLDLFMVSDIKIPKGGGMEIKFFDRLKALERLASFESFQNEDSSIPFYRALENSARTFARSDICDGDDDGD